MSEEELRKTGEAVGNVESNVENEVIAEDFESLKQALIEEKEKSEKYLAGWQRAQADFINYKRRIEQEKNEATDFANSALILGLLPVVDDLERAFASLPSEPQASNWADGIRLIYRKLQSILAAHGVTEIKAKGEKFDPRLHEAAMYKEEGEEDVVVEELQKGYEMKGRLLRPAMVIVGKGKSKDDPKKGTPGASEEK